MQFGVVGHVEWVEFARVRRLPVSGEIVETTEWWEEAAGGGSVAAVQLAKLAGSATFFTALGDDELGRRAHRELEDKGLKVHAAWRDTQQRRAFTFLEDSGERTITVLGDRLVPNGDDPLPWEELADMEAVYFTGGEGDALKLARKSGNLVATARTAATLAGAKVKLDALVLSEEDEAERYNVGEIQPPPRIVVTTKGRFGGTYAIEDGSTGQYEAAELPGPPADAYGCGDSFAAGLAFGLATAKDVDTALTTAARCGAYCAAGRGPYEGQLQIRH